MTPSEVAEGLEARHAYDKRNYPPASPLDRNAASTIRALIAENEAKDAEIERLRDALVEAGLRIRSLPGTDQSDVEFIRQALTGKEEKWELKE